MKYASYRSVFKMYEYIQPFLKYSVPLEDKLPADKILVIAPHQDDEVIGCGGSILKHGKSGGATEIVFCTNDSQERNEETKNACRILNSNVNHFLNFEIRSLYSNQNKLSERFTDLFEKISPDIIFMPFIIDNHQDHIAVSKAFVKSYKKRKINSLIYAYSVWTPLIPNVIADISDVWNEKQKAIECYKTQTATRDYVKMASSIAQYWSVVKGAGAGYCEVFLKAGAKQYVSLVKDIL